MKDLVDKFSKDPLNTDMKPLTENLKHQEEKLNKIKAAIKDVKDELHPEQHQGSGRMKRSIEEECPLISPKLHRFLLVNEELKTMKEVETKLRSRVESGGKFKPRDCRARHKTAFIIPYR